MDELSNAAAALTFRLHINPSFWLQYAVIAGGPDHQDRRIDSLWKLRNSIKLKAARLVDDFSLAVALRVHEVLKLKSIPVTLLPERLVRYSAVYHDNRN